MVRGRAEQTLPTNREPPRPPGLYLARAGGPSRAGPGEAQAGHLHKPRRPPPRRRLGGDVPGHHDRCCRGTGTLADTSASPLPGTCHPSD